MAKIRIGNEPTVPLCGVPEIVAVPFPLSWNARPAGSTPVSVMLGAGEPLVVTVKLELWPTVKLTLVELVIAGGRPA